MKIRDVVEVIIAFFAAYLFYQFLILISGTTVPVVSVASGSMIPKLYPGDIVIAMKPENLNIGDIIIYRANCSYLPNEDIIHRIIGFENDKLYFYSPKGVIEVSSKYYVFSLGARERNRGSIFIEGTRPSGVFTAGFAQYVTNILGLKIGNKIAILGSGDIGLIMARRLTLEGMKVVGVFEIMPFYGGLPRNIRQCIEDFEIPLYLSHTVLKIEGDERVEKIYVSEVDENLKPKGEIKEFEVDTLLLSVGLIPEIDILRKSLKIDNRTQGPIVNQYFLTNIKNTFVIGNSLTIFDLVDKAMNSSLVVLDYILKERKISSKVEIVQGNLIRSYVPQYILKDGYKAKIYFRVKEPIFNKEIILRENEKILSNKKIIALYPAEMSEIEIDTNLIGKDKLVLEVL